MQKYMCNYNQINLLNIYENMLFLEWSVSCLNGNDANVYSILTILS